MSLDVSNIVSVSVNLAPAAAQVRNFGIGLVVGDSNVINGLDRMRQYMSLTAVANDFGTTAPEYLGAQLFFDQSPQPAQCNIGRWLRTATAALLEGGILSSSQQTLTNFTAITAGGFGVVINGTATPITGLDFSTQTNLNGVANVITTALSGAATATWSGSQFILTGSTTGAGVKASGSLEIILQPTATDTVSVHGVSIEFVAATPTGNEVLIGGNAAQTAANLAAFLIASTNANLLQQTYSLSGVFVNIVAKVAGTAGNSVALAASNSMSVTVSASTLTGGAQPSTLGYATSLGSGQDVSALLGWTSVLASELVPGYAAETALAAVQALDALSTQWYGMAFAASVMPSDPDYVAIAGFIEADVITRFFGITSQESTSLVASSSSDIGSQIMALGYEQSTVQYSSSSPYAVISLLGRMASVNFEGTNSTITLMFKQEPGVIAEDLTASQAAVLQAKRINVFVEYDNSTNLLQYGTCAGPAWIDEINGLDWFANAVQTAVFNALYSSTTKIPQTDQGVGQLITTIGAVCQQAVTNGLVAPGVWNGPAFGQIVTGQYLKTGYYIYAQSVDLQSESDRAARKSPPIIIALKLAGAIQSVDVIVNVNR